MFIKFNFMLQAVLTPKQEQVARSNPLPHQAAARTGLLHKARQASSMGRGSASSQGTVPGPHQLPNWVSRAGVLILTGPIDSPLFSTQRQGNKSQVGPKVKPRN